MEDTSSTNQTQETQMSGTPSVVTSLRHGDAGDETTESSKHWGRAFRKFCETTTFHGLRNITATTSHVSRRCGISCCGKPLLLWNISFSLLSRQHVYFVMSVNTSITYVSQEKYSLSARNNMLSIDRTLDHCYTAIKGAYRSIRRAPLGRSDHAMVYLVPTSSCCRSRSDKDCFHHLTVALHLSVRCESDVHESIYMFLIFRFLLMVSWNRRRGRPLFLWPEDSWE